MTRWLPHVVAVAAVLLVKGLLALSLGDVFFHGEELEKGTVAKALLDGIPVPPHQLAYHYYEGGGFAISHLTAIAFLVVGQNLLAHKLVSLLVNVAIAVAGVSLVQTNFGRRAAYVFALFYTLAPIGFQKLSLLNLGIHYETSLFLLLAFHLALRLVFDESLRPRTVFAFGATLGFGVFFNFQMIPVAGFTVAAVLVMKRRVLVGPGLVYLVSGALIGALPFVFMVATVGRDVFDIHGTALFGGDGEEVDRLARLNEYGTWLAEGRGVLGFALLALQVALPIGGGLYLARSRTAGTGRPRRAATTLLLYLACFTAIYLASPFVVGAGFKHFRLQRLTPFWILGTVLTSATLGALLAAASSRGRTVGRVLVCVLLLVGADASRRAIAEGRPGELSANVDLLRATRGFAYPEYFAKLVGHLPGTEREKLEVLIAFDEPVYEILYAAAAEAVYRRSETPSSEILLTLHAADPARWPAFVHGLGPHFLALDNGHLRQALARAGALAPELRAHAFEAIGRSHHWLIKPEEMAMELNRARGLGLPMAYYRGFGHRLYRSFRLDREAALAFIAEAPAEHREKLRAGYEDARVLYLLKRGDS